MNETSVMRKFHACILLAYQGRGRDIAEAAALLSVEAGELTELFLKERWYGKRFDNENILSEAGDILNFLTFILLEHNMTLTDAMENNMKKLKDRGWIE